MRPLRTIGVLAVVMTMTASPIAWGCVAAGQAGCSMSDCPLGAVMASTDCHQTESSPELERDRLGDCCNLDSQEPASIAQESILPASRLEIAVSLVGPMPANPGPSATPPESASKVVLTQQHELGRFTFLSAFLL